MKTAVPLVATLACVAACTVPIAHFTVIGEPPSTTASVVTPAAAERVTGYSCRWWVLGVTLGLPTIEEAVSDAVSRSGANGLLMEADLVSLHPVYGPFGRHCYELSGTPWHPPRDDATPGQ